MEILVFKTDISSRSRISAVAPYLQNLQGIIKWNVDLHDADNILRIESEQLASGDIEQVLRNAGCYCEALPD